MTISTAGEFSYRLRRLKANEIEVTTYFNGKKSTSEIYNDDCAAYEFDLTEEQIKNL